MSAPADDDLPIASPVSPGARPGPRPGDPLPFPGRPLPPRDSGPTEGEEEGPPPSQTVAACSVIGCLGLAVIGAVALLAYITITLLNNANELNPNKRGTAVEQSAPPARG